MSAVELLPPGEAVHGNRRWYELRRQGVTASEIPVILGLSRWNSPWSLWHRKRGLIGDDPDSDNASWGRRLEPAIALAAGDRLDPNGSLRFLPAGLYRHETREWQMATPDRLVYQACAGCGDRRVVYDPFERLPHCWTCSTPLGNVLAVLEVKHPYSWDGWGDDGTDDIPADYMAQALWQCDVMGVDECWVAAYTRHEMRCYTIRATAEGADVDLELMRKLALEFLTSDEPPPLDSHPATLRAVKQLHPDVEDREELIPDWVGVDYRAACADLKRAEERKRQAEVVLRERLGNARYGVDDIGQRIVTRTVYETRRIDGKRLRADHPDLAAQYTTTSTVDKLIPRKDTEHGEDL